jgi:hypothetical protein
VKRRTKRNSDTDNSSVTVAMTINTQTKPERKQWQESCRWCSFNVRRSDVITITCCEIANELIKNNFICSLKPS